jgi:hypothetical protein
MEFLVVLVEGQELKPVELELVELEVEKLAQQHQHHRKEIMVELREDKMKKQVVVEVLVVLELLET